MTALYVRTTTAEPGFNSKLTYTPTSTGDYKIVVSSAVDERGTYRVKVKQK